jgi:hypothetical protein
MLGPLPRALPSAFPGLSPRHCLSSGQSDCWKVEWRQWEGTLLMLCGPRRTDTLSGLCYSSLSLKAG